MLEEAKDKQVVTDPILDESFLSKRYGKDIKGAGEDLYNAMYGVSTSMLKKRQTIYDPMKVRIQVDKIMEKPKTCAEKMLIHKEDKWKRVFDIFIALVAFQDENQGVLRVINIFVEILFLTDLILRIVIVDSFKIDFFEEYQDSLTLKMVQDYSLIAKHYFKTTFVIDFIALIPFHSAHTAWYVLKLLRLFRLPIFFKLFDMSRIVEAIAKQYEGGTRDQQAETLYTLQYGYKIFRLLLLTLLFTYFLGLLTYIISDNFNYEDKSDTFIKRYELKSYTNYEIVVRCMYFVLTTITTVGYGDFSPASNVERVYVMILELFGVAFFSYSMGNFIEIIMSYEQKMSVPDKSVELQTWLTLLSRFNDGKPLDRTMVSEIEDYFKYFWNEYRLEDITSDNQYLRIAPKESRYSVISKHLFSEVYYGFRNFFGVNHDIGVKFLYDMAFGLLPRKFKAGEIIYEHYDDVEEIYLIKSGTISVDCVVNKKRFPIAELGPKETMGAFYALKGWKSEFIYEAQTEVEAIGIPKEHFLKVLQDHPNKAKYLMKTVAGRYKTLSYAAAFKKARVEPVDDDRSEGEVEVKWTTTIGKAENIMKESKPIPKVSKDKLIKAEIEALTEELEGISKTVDDMHKRYNLQL